MSDNAAREIRMGKEIAAIKRYVGRADDGTTIDFTAMDPKPVAIAWRIGQTKFVRFESEHTARLFLEKWAHPTYRVAFDIRERDNA